MNISAILNKKELENAIFTQMEHAISGIQGYTLDNLKALSKGLSISNQRIFTLEDAVRLELPKCETLDSRVFVIDGATLNKAGIERNDVFITYDSMMRLFKGILKQRNATKLGVSRSDHIVLDIENHRFKCILTVECPASVRNRIILKILRNEIKAVMLEREEYEKYLALKNKYEPSESNL